MCISRGPTSDVCSRRQEHDACQDVQDEDGDHVAIFCLEDVVVGEIEVNGYESRGRHAGTREDEVRRISHDSTNDSDADGSLCLGCAKKRENLTCYYYVVVCHGS